MSEVMDLHGFEHMHDDLETLAASSNWKREKRKHSKHSQTTIRLDQGSFHDDYRDFAYLVYRRSGVVCPLRKEKEL